MRILSILEKRIKSLITEATTPETLEIGQVFEEYVLAHLFTNNYYELLERTHDYHVNKNHVKPSLKPDFTFRDKLTNQEFYIEAKFRTGECHGKIIWCDDEQLNAYTQYSKEKPFFLILGMGEKPNHPELVSLIPLAQATHTGLFYSLVDQFEIDQIKPVLSGTLWAI